VVTKFRFNENKMYCEWKLELRKHSTSYSLIEVVTTKAGLNVGIFDLRDF